MTRDDRAAPVYAPLLGRRVECATLHVARFSRRKLKPARDESGRIIELPVSAELDELRRRVAMAGRYRVSARDPTSGNLMAHSDFVLEPMVEASLHPMGASVLARAGAANGVAAREAPTAAGVEQAAGSAVGRRARVSEPPVAVRPAWGSRWPMRSADGLAHPPEWPDSPAHEPMMIGSTYAPSAESAAQFVATLRQTERHLRAELRECRMQADEELREALARADRMVARERERCEGAMRASEEALEAWRLRAREAEVRLAGASAWLEEREARVAMLERRVAELEGEAAEARRLAARLKRRAEEAAFSPLDALSHVDQAVELLGKAVGRFGGEG